MQEYYASKLNQLPLLSTGLKNASVAKEKREIVQYSPAFDLTTFNRVNGFVVNGIANSDHLGYSVSTAGDGKTDLMLGAPYAGAAYII